MKFKRSILSLLVCFYLADITRGQIPTSGVGGSHGSAAINSVICAYLAIYSFKKGRDEGEAQGKNEGMERYVTRKCTPLSNTATLLANCKACLLTNPADMASCTKANCIFQANAQSCTFTG